MNQIKKDTTVRSFPGATVPTPQNKLDDYNIEKCKIIMIHVGGNDADKRVNLDTFCAAIVHFWTIWLPLTVVS